MNTVYIAGPMRGYENYNFDSFFKAEDLLKKQGFKVLNPAQMDLENNCDPSKFPADFDFSKEPEDMELKEFVIRDVLALCECTHIYMLKGWEKSVGANAELAVSKWLQLQVIYEDKS
jgi:hypothetical protein